MLPTFVLTSTNADDTFLKSLEDKLATLSLPPSATVTASSSAASTTDTETATATGKIQIEYRPARDFYSTAGKHALSRVKVLDSDHDDSEPRELEEEIERMLDDRATRQAELGLEALLNNLSANPLTVRIAARAPPCQPSFTGTDLLDIPATAWLRRGSARAHVDRSRSGWRLARSRD